MDRNWPIIEEDMPNDYKNKGEAQYKSNRMGKHDTFEFYCFGFIKMIDGYTAYEYQVRRYKRQHAGRKKGQYTCTESDNTVQFH